MAWGYQLVRQTVLIIVITIIIIIIKFCTESNKKGKAARVVSLKTVINYSMV